MRSYSIRCLACLGCITGYMLWQTTCSQADPPSTTESGRIRGGTAELSSQTLISQSYRDANALCWEMHKNYQDQPNFQIIYKKAYLIDNLASLLPNLRQETQLETIKTMKSLQKELAADIAPWLQAQPPNSSQQLSTLLDRSRLSIDQLARVFKVSPAPRYSIPAYPRYPYSRGYGESYGFPAMINRDYPSHYHSGGSYYHDSPLKVRPEVEAVPDPIDIRDPKD